MTNRLPNCLAVAGVLIGLMIAGCGPGTVNQGSISDSSGDPAPERQQQAQPEIPTWGKRYSWKNGLAVEIAPPVSCTPGEYAVSSAQDIKRAVKFTFTIINGTDEVFRADNMIIGSDAQFDGRTSHEIYDSSGGCGGGFDAATVLPGKTFTTEVAFAVGSEPGEMQIALRPMIGGDEAVFVGQV